MTLVIISMNAQPLWLQAQDLKNIKPAKFPHREALPLTKELLEIGGFYRREHHYFEGMQPLIGSPCSLGLDMKLVYWENMQGVGCGQGSRYNHASTL